MKTLSITVRLSESELAKLVSIGNDLKEVKHRWQNQTYSDTVRDLINDYVLPNPGTSKTSDIGGKTNSRSQRKTASGISGTVRRSRTKR
jgi:hypothetical protein